MIGAPKNEDTFAQPIELLGLVGRDHVDSFDQPSRASVDGQAGSMTRGIDQLDSLSNAIDSEIHLSSNPSGDAHILPQPISPSTRWRLSSVGPNATAYESMDAPSDHSRIRMILREDGWDAQQMSDLRQRLALIQLTRSPSILAVSAIAMTSSPPSFVMDNPDRRPWKSIVDQLRLADQISIAGQLVAMFRDAHRVGLTLPAGRLFDSAMISIVQCSGNDPRLCVDYSGVDCGEVENLASRAVDQSDLSNQDSVQRDLLELRNLLRVLLPQDDRGADVTDGQARLLGGRSRAAARRLLSDSGEVPGLDQWLSVLDAIVPDRAEAKLGSEMLLSQADDEDSDSTGVFPIAEVSEQHPLALDKTVDRSAPAGFNLDDENLRTGELPIPGQRPADPLIGQSLGRFRIDAIVGQGGMGTVYSGIDLTSGAIVAVKVLRNDLHDIAQAIRRFRKETRLLADVQNDHVVKLHHVGMDQGMHFMAMEFVDGIDLKTWSQGRLPLNAVDALSVIADVSRALVEAHKKEIVHRDIKPENVLMGRRMQGDDSLGNLRIKLTDFGIARHVQQSESLEVTKAGTMLGTPRYMSPEQCRGDGEIGVEADVYALGVSLYELLTGKTPFQADDPIKMAAKHCFESPPPIARRDDDLSDAAAQIVMRMLAKEPSDRFANASELLQEIERVLRGETADFQAHPQLPPHDPARIWKKAVQWDLDSSVDEMWPLVSNTERLNRAIGLPPVQYETIHDSKRGLRKFGSFRLGGVQIRWEEHPFEWVEGQRMGVLREFSSGPFKWFMSIVTLSPRGAGSQLTHEIRIEYRNLFGRVLTKVEADWKGFRQLDRTYRRIDRSVQQHHQSNVFQDVFESPTQLDRNAIRRLDQRIEAVAHAGGDITALEKLGDFIRHAPPQPLAQIRPRALADQLAVPEDLMIDTCLVAASQGLLSLRWDVLCPTCRVSASTTDMLSQIGAHTRCEACDVSFRSNVAEVIELVFRPHPDIRSVDDQDYCIGGPEHSPHVVVQVRIEAGERMELPVRLSPGDYILRSARLPRTQSIRVQHSAAPSHCDVILSRVGESTNIPTLRQGMPTIRIVNDDTSLHVVRIERTASRTDCLTAAVVSTMPRFRKLFPEQTFDTENPVTSEHLTLLATTVVNIESIYEQFGERESYELIKRQQKVLGEIVARNRGSVCKTIGESCLAVFESCDNAVMAAMEFDRIAKNDKRLVGLVIGQGLHRGRTLVATENSRLDYVGSSVRAVQALPPMSEGEILMTESVFADVAVVARLGSQLAQSTVSEVRLPGIADCRVQSINSDPGNKE
ncbi:Serine/threonine-protein kinase PrkC [Rubripirellula lacrimiformis]|uniref:Serine/threonine-protein kinase PrkC n=1 Tax=Rubripirellula lacrimiformis TaxID=1930273 RepID=A0A517NBZ1_9BACT|nr:protein kinase [Rubripirellula lacrimiformis]QDT04621.1 Serine/threonine-protein kinase PrkC [Rubripirellula lacrimiformis]